MKLQDPQGAMVTDFTQTMRSCSKFGLVAPHLGCPAAGSALQCPSLNLENNTAPVSEGSVTP